MTFKDAFKDYYAVLGVERGAPHEAIRRAYRKLARQFHPDVSKEANAEARFKEIAEAHEALTDPERRTAYDEIVRRHDAGQPYTPPPGWDSGGAFDGRRARPRAAAGAGDDGSSFYDSMFGRAGMARGWQPGGDHHAKVTIALLDSYNGARRTITLRVPATDSLGRSVLQDRQLEVGIPKGVRAGQQLRLAGQGQSGRGGAPAGDLYLEVLFRPQPPFRVDGGDVHVELPLSPWEAALGARVAAPTPQGEVELGIPAASTSGRQLRLKGRGLPAANEAGAAGHLYVTLMIALPPGGGEAATQAWQALHAAFPDFDPRRPDGQAVPPATQPPAGVQDPAATAA